MMYFFYSAVSGQGTTLYSGFYTAMFLCRPAQAYANPSLRLAIRTGLQRLNPVRPYGPNGPGLEGLDGLGSAYWTDRNPTVPD